MKTVEMCNLTESSSPDRKPRDLHNNTNTFRALHMKEREREGPDVDLEQLRLH